MGRAGSGSGGGGHSGGGHSSERTSGGHRPGGNQRAGTQNRTQSRRPAAPPPPPYYSGYSFRPSGRVIVYNSPFGWAICMIVVLVLLTFSLFGNHSGIPKSTHNREKVVSSVSYNNDCIIDELGWFDDISKTETELKGFYDKTGVMPYVVLRKYDNTLTSDDAKQKYAENWYDSHIANENTFLFMYFAEPSDDDVGYMAYVNGKQATSVMDTEAVDVFWAYIDKYWYSDMSTDAVITQAFNDTANRIMKHTNTAVDIIIMILKIILVVAFVGGIIAIMATRRKHKKEANEEAKKILETPLKESEADDLVKKYSVKKNEKK